MTNEDLDRILSGEGEIVPSAGFTALVMEKVRLEETAPPPIPFPWKRALPGLVVVGLALGAVLVGLAEVVWRAWATPPAATEELVVQPLPVALYAVLGSVALALLISLAALLRSDRGFSINKCSE